LQQDANHDSKKNFIPEITARLYWVLAQSIKCCANLISGCNLGLSGDVTPKKWNREQYTHGI
jgi:hypothetical protein